MEVASALWGAARSTGTPWVVGGFLLTVLLVRRFVPEDRRRLRSVLILSLVHLALVPWVAYLPGYGDQTGSGLLPSADQTSPPAFRPTDDHDVYLVLRSLCVFFAAAALIWMGSIALFKVLLRRLGYEAPKILRDVVGAGLGVLVVFWLASQAGVHLASLIATSAVMTAVIGWALQDTLGNVIGGLMLHSDQSIAVGDWIRFNDVVGRVLDVRWRYTAVETRNWDTLIIPNGQIVKNAVLVCGRRQGQPRFQRRLIEFTVDFRFAPTTVIRTAEEAVRHARIPRVAEEPAPNCVLMGFTDSTARYHLRYFLTDLAVDDPTDSEVRIRIYFGLQRAGIPLSIPAHTLFLTQNDLRRVEDAHKRLEVRRGAIDRIDLFKRLPDDERQFLADGLVHAPFGRGEVMTRQGAEAHWLYLIIRGRASVRVAVEGGLESEVATLSDGTFFGELSLVTGEPRTATVVALTDVDCYRLDQQVFRALIQRRPALADEVADILARRRMELLAVKEGLDLEAQKRRLSDARRDLLDRIRNFFGLDDEGEGGA